jgi:hypothetical protein
LPKRGPFPEIDETRDKRDGKALRSDISQSRFPDFSIAFRSMGGAHRKQREIIA